MRRISGARRRTVIIFIALVLLNIAAVFNALFLRDQPAGDNPSSSDLTSGSHITVSETEPPALPDSVTVTMAGDVIVHDRALSYAQTGENTYDFEPFFSEFGAVFKADLNIVNLETQVDIWGGNKKLTGFPYFNAPSELLTALKNLHIDTCITANNHCFDSKQFAGLAATLENVKASGMDVVGTYAAQENADELYIKEINGIKVGVAAYTEHTNGVYIPPGDRFCVKVAGKDFENIDIILDDINRMRTAGAEFIIVSLHWGYEYEDNPSGWQTEAARRLCESGADVIMGTHPHVVQPIEKITVEREDGARECIIAYSLGNFFSYQLFPTGETKFTDLGMILSVRAERGGDGAVRLAEAFYLPIYLQRVADNGTGALRLRQLGRFAGSADADANARAYWERVTRIAGDAILAVDDMENAPF